MRQIGLSVTIIFFVMILKNEIIAQDTNHTPKAVTRIYEDNDFINLRGKGTDEAYTNGIRLDYLYEKNSGSRLLLNSWMPTAGSNAVNTFGWGLMQIMYTPSNIRNEEPEKDDFPYAGALFIIRSLRSENVIKKAGVNTELLVGLIGPYSFAKEAQIAFHKLINYQKPMGWNHQLKTSLVLNFNFSAEKQFWNYRDKVNVTGGGKIMVGTMWNGVSGYTIIRAGKMNPLFNGQINHLTGSQEKTAAHRKNFQIYVMGKPHITYIQKNTLIGNGLLTKESEGITGRAVNLEQSGTVVPNKIKYGFDYGFMVSMKNLNLEITQKVETAEIKGKRHHEVGNISIYIVL